MSTANHVTLYGFLPRDPQIRENSDGSHKILMTIGTEMGAMDKETGKPIVSYVNTEAFVPAASPMLNVYNKLVKGSTVLVDAEIRSGQYADKQTGETVYTQTVHITNLGPVIWPPKGADAGDDAVAAAVDAA